MRRLTLTAAALGWSLLCVTIEAMAQPLPPDLTPAAMRLVAEGDAYAARAALLRARIASLEARRERLRSGSATAQDGSGPTRSRSDAAEGADSEALTALDAEIEDLRREALASERRAKAAWEQAVAIDAAASNAILQRLIETSLE